MTYIERYIIMYIVLKGLTARSTPEVSGLRELVLQLKRRDPERLRQAPQQVGAQSWLNRGLFSFEVWGTCLLGCGYGRWILIDFQMMVLVWMEVEFFRFVFQD